MRDPGIVIRDHSRLTACSGLRAESILQLFPIPATQGEARTGAEQHGILTVQPRLEFLDTLHVDDPGAVNPEELFWIEPAFNRVHGLAEKMRGRSDMKADVIARRLDPIDLVGAQEEQTPSGLHDQTIGSRLIAPQILDEREQTPAQITALVAFDLLPGALQ